MPLLPVLLVIVSLVTYQVAAKLSPANVTPWATLTVVYAIALTISLLRVATERQSLVATGFVDPRFLVTAVVLGIAVVGIEYGYLAAHRGGWELAIVGLVGAAGGTAALAAIGFALFDETLSPRRIVGLGLALVGLTLLAWRQPAG
jgi:multidrug transporter EmrE-like cation transporter